MKQENGGTLPQPELSLGGALPVLGLFRNEAGLRDHIAEHLELVEPDLELLKTEYWLDNPNGAGGRIDILARDRFDHVVCIELKRSDQVARSALNELSKYVALLCERDRVPREMIRCIVVSTHWSDLLLPLSYFAASSGVDVVALKAVAEDGVVKLEPVELLALQFLPQLCPGMNLYWFDETAPRDQFVAIMRRRSRQLPFMRVALLLLEPRSVLTPGRSPFGVLCCVWRTSDSYLEAIERVTGKPIGRSGPYAAQGWEAELDALNWIDDVLGEIEGKWGFNHATSESLRNMLSDYHVPNIVKIGDWPKLEFINNERRILDAVLALSPLGGSDRPNRHSFEALVTPAIAPSYKAAVSAFLSFIDFEPVWRNEAEAFLEAIPQEYEVHLHAFDKKHLFLAIHQGLARCDAGYSFFSIDVAFQSCAITRMLGFYRWDGASCPPDAKSVIEQVYGSVGWAKISLISSVDDQRYEAALSPHGFIPHVEVYVSEEDFEERGNFQPSSIADFVRVNRDYAEDVSRVLESTGILPTDPAD